MGNQSHLVRQPARRRFTMAPSAADVNKDGSISAGELKDIMLCMCPPGEKDEVDEMVPMLIKMMGGGAEQKVKTSEVVNFLSNGPESKDPKEKYKMMFRMTDLSGDGFLSMKELAIFMSMDDDPFMSQMVTLMMSQHDKDGDGKLSYEEFCGFMEKADEKK